MALAFRECRGRAFGVDEACFPTIPLPCKAPPCPLISHDIQKRPRGDAAWAFSHAM